jgi:hypothetical protein
VASIILNIKVNTERDNHSYKNIVQMLPNNNKKKQNEKNAFVAKGNDLIYVLRFLRLSLSEIKPRIAVRNNDQ